MASRPVEEKIVKLSVDNANFKRALSESAQAFNNFGSSLGNVKTDGLKNVESSAKTLGGSLRALVGHIPIIGGIADKFIHITGGVLGVNDSLSGLGEQLTGVAAKFSIVRTAATLALSGSIAKGITAAAGALKGITIDPIIDGYEEYGTKMKSITTIMTNSGKSVGEVNKVLQDLNTYSDKTIYSFSDMTQAIGTMAAAGIDINTASTAIQGFYNLAAGTGIEAARAGGLLDTAMNQAISMGKMDYANWKQLQSAGMGGPKFQNALVENAKAMGKNVDLSNGFNESLKEGWATTDVLLATLKQFSTDKSLLEAATQVKTFGELVGTVQESVGSGWATTWELVFGNADQAKVLWTGINNIIGPIINNMSNSRNSMLQLWQSMGGRDKMVSAITNAFDSLGKIINTIGGAFNEVFPKSSEAQAKGLTAIMGKLADALKISDGSLNAVKQTATLFFTILKGAGYIVGGFIKVIQFLIPDHLVTDILLLAGMITTFGNTVVKIGGIIGKGLNLNWLSSMFKGSGKETKSFSDKFTAALLGISTNFDKFTKDTIAKFQAFIDNLVKTSGAAGNAISGGFVKVSEFFGKLKTVVEGTTKGMGNGLSFIQSFGQAIQTVFGNTVISNLSLFIDGLTGVDDGLIKMGKTVPAIAAFGASIRASIGDAIQTVSSYLDKFINWSNEVGNQVPGAMKAVINVFAKAASVLNSFIKGTEVFATSAGKNMAAGADTITSITDVIAEKWTGFTTAMAPILRPIGTLFVGIGHAISDVMDTMNTSSILKTGLVVGLFKFYKSMDGKETIFDKIKGAISSFFGIFTKIGSFDDFDNILDGVQKSLKSWQNNLRAKTIKEIAISIGIIAGSIVALSFVEPVRLATATGAIAAAASVLMGAFIIFGKIKVGNMDTAKIIAAANGMAIAMGFMSLAIKHLDGMDPVSALVAVGSLGTLTTILGGVMIGISKWGSTGPASATAMLIIAGAVDVMAGAVKKIGDMDPDKVAVGLGAMVGIMASMAILVKAMSGGSKITAASALTMGAIALSLSKMAKVINVLGSMDINTLLQGMATLGTLMGGVVLVAKSLSGAKGMGGAAVLLGLATSMNILIVPITALGLLPIPVLIQGLIGMGVALTELAGAALLASGSGPGAAAISLLAAAVNLLIVPITALGLLPISVIAVGLGALAGGLGVLVAAGYAATPASVGLAALSTAILSISTAIGVTAVALPLIATGLGMLVASVALNAKLIVSSIKVILDGIGSLGPSIGNAISGLISGIATGISDSVGSIMDAASNIIKAIAGALVDNTQVIADAILKILEVLLQTLTDHMPELVTSIGELIIIGINSIATFITNNIDAILHALAQVQIAILTVISTGLQDMLKLIPFVGPDLAKKLKGATDVGISAIDKAFPAQAQLVGANAGTKMASSLESKAGDTQKAAKKHKDASSSGLSGIENMLGGMGGGAGSAYATRLAQQQQASKNAAMSNKNATTGGLSGIQQALGGMGGGAGSAYATSLSAKAGAARGAGHNVKSAAEGGASGGSLHGAGSNLGQSLANGMNSKTGESRNAGENNARAAAGGAQSQDLYGSGQSLMGGFASGIGSMVDAVKGAAHSVLKKVRDLFPFSPAKEGPFSGRGYTTYSGAALFQGFAEGMLSEQGNTVSTAKTVMNGVASTIDLIQNGIDNTLNLNPVITPVMDLSNISDVDINGNLGGINSLQNSMGYVSPIPNSAVSIGQVSIPINVPDGQSAEDTMDIFRDKFHQVMEEEIRKAI